jgi:hypothetical protein
MAIIVLVTPLFSLATIGTSKACGWWRVYLVEEKQSTTETIVLSLSS